MLRNPPTATRWLACLLLAACSSAPTERGEDPGPAPVDTSVFDACADFASRLCADAEGCCRQAHGGFALEACVDSLEREVCRPGADLVAVGKARFDAGAIEGCLRAHAEAHAVCVPSWAETLELREKIYGECRVIDGLVEPGGGCSVAATCKRPPGAASAECVKNVCVTVAILVEGEACPFPSGSVSVCGAGLTCDALPGDQGHCVRAVAEGEPCNGNLLEGTECGLGNYCDRVSSTCRLATNMGGSGCAQSTECVSFECNRLDDECAPAPAVISRDRCLGAD